MLTKLKQALYKTGILLLIIAVLLGTLFGAVALCNWFLPFASAFVLGFGIWFVITIFVLFYLESE